jgi:integrase
MVNKREGSWGYRLTFTNDNGERKYVSRYRKQWSKVDAQRELTAQLALVDAGHNLGSAQTTVGEYLETWFARWANTDTVKRSTIDTARVHLDVYLIPRIGKVKLRDLKAARVSKLYAELRTSGKAGGRGTSTTGQPLSPKTVRNVAGTLHKALKDAVRLGIIATNPTDQVDVPKWERPELQTYDATQVVQFLAHCSDTENPHTALWRLLLLVGLRRGELLGLTWDDVDLVNYEVTVRQTRQVNSAGVQYLDTPKTAAGRRRVSVDVGTVDALALLKDAQEKSADFLGGWSSPYVATDLDGQPVHPLAITRRFKALAKVAGLPEIRLHDGRHTALTLALDAGVPMHVVSGRAGHSRVSTTLDVYSHRLPATDRDAVDKTQDYLATAIENHRRNKAEQPS